ncbi:MAG: hypothetical protein WD011_00950 [Nitriliruptoraceae bacterium]
MAEHLLHFLVVFDHDRRQLVGEIRTFLQAPEAIEAYSAAEREYEGQPRIEVVLLGSDSIETLQRTHPNYFPENGPTAFSSRVAQYLEPIP